MVTSWWHYGGTLVIVLIWRVAVVFSARFCAVAVVLAEIAENCLDSALASYVSLLTASVACGCVPTP